MGERKIQLGYWEEESELETRALPLSVSAFLCALNSSPLSIILFKNWPWIGVVGIGGKVNGKFSNREATVDMTSPYSPGDLVVVYRQGASDSERE